MPKKDFIEAFKIINTHGIAGEVKCEVFCDCPDMLKEIKTFYAGNTVYSVVSFRIHGNFILIKFKGIDTVEDAARLKNRILTAKREDFILPPGKIFICDIIGLPVYDKETDKMYGTLKDVLLYEPHKIFVIETETGDVLLPDVPEFISSADPDSGKILITPIEGFFN